jgi:hypothetical protein
MNLDSRNIRKGSGFYESRCPRLVRKITTPSVGNSCKEGKNVSPFGEGMVLPEKPAQNIRKSRIG